MHQVGIPLGEGVQEVLSGVYTPLLVENWELLLGAHPDAHFKEYILWGLKNGFRIGCSRTASVSSAKRNMMSANEHPEVVSEYLSEELERGALLGPFDREEVRGVVTNRFGVIPKSGKSGKWRLIVDLSHPEGRSVNDGIDPGLCSLKYVRVDDVVRRLVQMGPGAEMAKIDVKSAYRIVPVHPSDRWMLGIYWNGGVFVVAALPFGLRSAPKIFNALADAVEWMAKRQGKCESNLLALKELCTLLGIPLAEEKVEGPSTSLTFLGIEIDTVAGEVRLPRAKLELLVQELEVWKRRKRCTKRELLLITGKLQQLW